MHIELEANDPLLNNQLLTYLNEDINENDLFPGGASLSFGIKELRESTGVPEILSIVVSFAGQTVTVVAINIFSSWLWDKLTKRKVKITEIDGLDVHFNDKGEFQRILAKKIRIEE